MSLPSLYPSIELSLSTSLPTCLVLYSKSKAYLATKAKSEGLSAAREHSNFQARDKCYQSLPLGVGVMASDSGLTNVAERLGREKEKKENGGTERKDKSQSRDVLAAMDLRLPRM